MIPFREIDITDKEWITDCLKQSDFMGCEYSFANNIMWAVQYKLRIANVNGFYCTKGGLTDKQVYGYPAGTGDIKETIELLIEDAKENGIRFEMRGFFVEQVELLQELFPGRFRIEAIRDDFDYIYRTEKLTTLAGKKLHGKRNHIARFKDNPDWSYEKITKENLLECQEMSKKWCEVNECSDNDTLKQEACAVKRAIKNFEALDLTGGLLRLNGEVIAFTIGEPLNSNTYVIHIEKAFSDIQGAYPMINQQFVIAECQNYEYINREDDMGEEGLRRAKMSYYPDILLEKYRAVLIG